MQTTRYFPMPDSAAANPNDARARLTGDLAGRAAADWLARGRECLSRGDAAAAAIVFESALAHYPDDAELIVALAGVHWHRADAHAAEALLRPLLERRPDHVAAAFALARICRTQGRMLAVERIVSALCAAGRPPLDVLILAVELLDDCGRKRAAARICEDGIAAGADDPRLHAYAGMLQIQCGDFDAARRHYLHALDRSPLAVEWQAAYGLANAQRYADPAHPDLDRFARLLERPDLTPRGRASVLFALGKAADDLGDVERASRFFREGNALVKSFVDWRRRNWRRTVEARLASARLPALSSAPTDPVPVFIVGAPRSGTTLLAELLSRRAGVCNRGETGWLPQAARQVANAARPTADVLAAAAADYLAQVRQDDADARWFIDKHPLNFLHLDLIASLFPQAKVLHCRRSPRDTALSIWVQYFAGPDYGFAYDFQDVEAVLHGADRLVAKARRDAAFPLREVRYEDLARAPESTVAAIADWIGLPGAAASPDAPASAIGTASLWQARQPVYTRAIGRWRAYAPFVPELSKFADA